MRRLVMTILLMGFASHAQAMVQVTNLSGTPQAVTFHFAGSDTTETIAPNATARFSGGDGMLSLVKPEQKAKASSAKPGVGGRIFGDMIAANRTERIPARRGDAFVVWPDGRLLIQQRGVGTGRGGSVF
jgi:hypothetical protein